MQHLFGGEVGGPFGIYPENDVPVALFMNMHGQWRWLSGGMEAVRTGLDYSALPVVMDMMGVAAERRADAFDCVQVMEAAFLAEESRRISLRRRA